VARENIQELGGKKKEKNTHFLFFNIIIFKKQVETNLG
jgi:hypothetical protein